MVELWFRVTGITNSPALICRVGDVKSRTEFFDAVVTYPGEISFGGRFASPELAMAAIHETTNPAYPQQIVRGDGVEV